MEQSITLAKELHGKTISWLIKGPDDRLVIGTRDRKIIVDGLTEVTHKLDKIIDKLS